MALVRQMFCDPLDELAQAVNEPPTPLDGSPLLVAVQSADPQPDPTPKQHDDMSLNDWRCNVAKVFDQYRIRV